MADASLVPSLNEDVHLVLCDFGRAALAYVETDPAEADATTVVQNLPHGQYERPMRVLALNVDEGWSRDLSEVIAAKVRDVAIHAGELAVEPHLQILRRNRRSLLLRLEYAHRSTLENHVHRSPRLGSRRSLIVRVGITPQLYTMS